MNAQQLTLPNVPFLISKWDGNPLKQNVVYFFLLGGDVVYIGSTSDLRARDYDAVRAQYPRDEIWYFATQTRGEALDCEQWLIRTMQPRFNKFLNCWRYTSAPYPPFFVYGNSIIFGHKAA